MASSRNGPVKKLSEKAKRKWMRERLGTQLRWTENREPKAREAVTFGPAVATMWTRKVTPCWKKHWA
jgi:hypothetical protein